jgi:chemotaxis response regulator CheB
MPVPQWAKTLDGKARLNHGETVFIGAMTLAVGTLPHIRRSRRPPDWVISKPRGWPDVITVFLRSLTQNWNGQLIAVIVSGYDGDGAAALCGIKDIGGITIAQTPDTAGQPDMPESAIASGCIDFILSPEAIAREIIRIAKQHSRPLRWTP